MNILSLQHLRKLNPEPFDASDSRSAKNPDVYFDPGDRFQELQAQLYKILQQLNSLEERSSQSRILLVEIYYERLKTIEQRLNSLESIIPQSPTVSVEQTFVSKSYESPMVKIAMSLFKWYGLCFVGFSAAIVLATALGAEQIGLRLLDLTLQGVLRLVVLPLIVFIAIAVLEPLRS